MDAIAQLANVSKQTVYAHFQNKEALFTACIECKVASYGFKPDRRAVGSGCVDGRSQTKPDGEVGADTRAFLISMVRNFTRLLLDPEVIAMYRAVMGEASSNPRIARLFFDSGPRNTRTFVQSILLAQVEQGRLHIPSDRLSYAANQLLNNSIGTFQLQMLLALEEKIDDAEIDAHCARVVEDFLILYGSAPSGHSTSIKAARSQKA